MQEEILQTKPLEEVLENRDESENYTYLQDLSQDVGNIREEFLNKFDLSDNQKNFTFKESNSSDESEKSECKTKSKIPIKFSKQEIPKQEKTEYSKADMIVFNDYKNDSLCFNVKEIKTEVKSYSSDIIRQITDKLNGTIEIFKETITIKLHPEHLGDVNIFVDKISKDAVNIKMFVENEEVKEIINKNINELKEKINLLNFKIETIEVFTLGSQAHQQYQKQRDDRQKKQKQIMEKYKHLSKTARIKYESITNFASTANNTFK